MKTYPTPVLKRLRENGFDITSIYEAKRGMTDEEVARIATAEDRILITFDKDFGMIIFVENITIPGLIPLRFPPKSIEYIYSKLHAVLELGIDFKGKIVSIH
ncbi:DUF5615 family PIN-like protein [Thermococcus sp.]|uniref:DUF5615 family PIN-like protein n=1 Tax=Thermococcus sp. TaxID=35749 RepID=UPI00262E251B|nr:DUF5615 family PIN-like protein [Thermococcus sp.]